MHRSSKKIEIKLHKIEERSSKPPGPVKFQRFRQQDLEEREEKTLFDDESYNINVLCQQLLVGGFVQSYVDFYQLTHRVDPTKIQDAGMSQIQMSKEDTVFIRDNLVKAEVSRRQGDTLNVYHAFNQLADFFVRNQDWQTSLFFHEKCLEVSQLTNDVRAEMSANNALGNIYQLMNEVSKSRPYHERHEEIASSLDIFEEVAKSNVALYKVYWFLAERAFNQNNIDETLKFYKKCLHSAQKSWDKAAESEANGKIGNLLLNRGDAQQSVHYLRQQAQLSADLGNAEGRCRACSALALALDSMGQSDKALLELQLVVSVSDQVGDTYLQAQACRALGTMLSKLGRLQEAVKILERHFNLLKKIMARAAARNNGVEDEFVVTMKDLDMARAYIGVSKGNLVMGKYMFALQSNLPLLLEWKLDRTDMAVDSDDINNVDDSKVVEQQQGNDEPSEDNVANNSNTEGND